MSLVQRIPNSKKDMIQFLRAKNDLQSVEVSLVKNL